MRRSALVTCLVLLGMLVSRGIRAGDARTSKAMWRSLNGETDLVALSRAMLRCTMRRLPSKGDTSNTHANPGTP